MLSFVRLSGDSGCIELEFLEREATPEPAMKLGIRLHLAGLSLSDTVSVLERLGVNRHRSTVHRWVKKDLQPTDGADPNHVAVDETVIQLNDERYWLYAAVDPEYQPPASRSALSDEKYRNYLDVSLGITRETSGRRRNLSRRRCTVVAGGLSPTRATIPACYTWESECRRTCLS